LTFSAKATFCWSSWRFWGTGFAGITWAP